MEKGVLIRHRLDALLKEVAHEGEGTAGVDDTDPQHCRRIQKGDAVTFPSTVKSHYELLNLTPPADAEAIKKAFRREIARYHPDKVVHLGAEFQDMAATRAAELTVAYKR